MMVFDTHSHISLEEFAGDRREVLARMADAGVMRALMAVDPTEDVTTARKMCAEHDNLCFAAGVHPHNASQWTDECERIIRECAHEKGFVCVGEIGLDYHYDLSPRESQREVFERQLDIALDMGYPAQLHIRDAHGETMEMLRARAARGRMPEGSIMHCFTGSWECAKVYLSLGMYISLSGAVTFKNAPKLAEVAKNMPADRLLVETDCPYMAPVPLRGRRNEPAFIVNTVAKIAAIREVSPDAMARITWENALRAFHMEDAQG
jgi:TatD DNase family protein